MPPLRAFKANGQQLSGSSGVVVWTVEGAAGVDEARNTALAASDESIDGIARNDDGAIARDVNPATGVYTVEIPYARPGLPQIGGGVPRVLITFDFQSTTQTVFNTAINKVVGFGSPATDNTTSGGVTSNARYNGMIGVGQNGDVVGTSIEDCQINFEANYELKDADVTPAFIIKFYRLAKPNHLNKNAVNINIGSVLLPKIITFPAKSLRFRGGRVSRNDNGNWGISASMCAAGSISRLFNYTNINGSSPTEQQTTLTADGHDAIWFPMQTFNESGKIITKPIGAMVHQVYPLDEDDGLSFSDLQIPAT